MHSMLMAVNKIATRVYVPLGNISLERRANLKFTLEVFLFKRFAFSFFLLEVKRSLQIGMEAVKIIYIDRNILILRFLYFTDHLNLNKDDGLFRIRHIIDNFCSTFKNLLYLFQITVIDNFRSFRQYLVSKRHRFGVRFLVMVDCKMKREARRFYLSVQVEVRK